MTWKIAVYFGIGSLACAVSGCGGADKVDPRGARVTVDVPPPASPSEATPRPSAAANGAADATPVDVHIARQRALAEAAEYGMIGTLGPSDGGAPPWGRADEPASGGALRAGHPKIHLGQTVVAGRLPPEVIQRIVRQSFGSYRACYERGLAANAKLEGTVRVKFVIGEDGAVDSAVTESSTLPDASVVACVMQGFKNMSFPAPEGGRVNVIYPIRFSPAADKPGSVTDKP